MNVQPIEQTFHQFARYERIKGGMRMNKIKLLVAAAALCGGLSSDCSDCNADCINPGKQRCERGASTLGLHWLWPVLVAT